MWRGGKRWDVPAGENNATGGKVLVGIKSFYEVRRACLRVVIW